MQVMHISGIPGNVHSLIRTGYFCQVESCHICGLFDQRHGPHLDKIPGLNPVHIDAAGQTPSIEIRSMLSCCHQLVNKRDHMAAGDIEHRNGDMCRLGQGQFSGNSKTSYLFC